MVQGSDKKGLEYDYMGIGAVIETRRLEVPRFQRSYSWLYDEVTEFWDDLAAAIERDDPEYFLGTIILSASEAAGRDVVIDGQQRLATTSMLLAAIRDAFRDLGEDTRADMIQAKYLASEDLTSLTPEPHLALNKYDDNCFRKAVIVEGGSAEPKRDSHARLLETNDELLSWVMTIVVAAPSPSDATKDLIRWATYVGDRARVMLVTVPTIARVFLVFETINDRGRDLTVADLLKNYLFSVASGRVDSVEAHWTTAASGFEAADSNVSLVVFVRHFWSSYKGRVREKELFSSIKRDVRTEQEAVDFAEMMETAADQYGALLGSDYDYWSDLGRSAGANVETLLRLGLEQNRPLLLAAMREFDKRELHKLLHALVSWSVRGLIVGGIGGGTAERVYCEAAQRISDRRMLTVSQTFDVLKPIIPADDVFKSVFAQYSTNKPQLARYLLLALERAQVGDTEPEMVPNDDVDAVNLEHVLPQRPDATEWPAFHQEDLGAWAKRIGNMALLRKSENKRIGNKSYPLKRPALAASSLKLTASAAKADEWSPQTVTVRQAHLAELALVAWPRQAT